MTFVVVVTSKKTGRVAFVDGIFEDSQTATEHADSIERKLPQCNASVEVVTDPR